MESTTLLGLKDLKLICLCGCFVKRWSLFYFSIFLCLLNFNSFAAPKPAGEVFQMAVKVQDPNTLEISWQIQPGYFLYRERIHVHSLEEKAVTLGALHFPEALKKPDRQGGVISIYRRDLSLPLPVLGGQAGETLITVQYQGCSDGGFCYPPETGQIKLGFDDKLALISAERFKAIPTEGSPQKTATPAPSSLELVFTQHYWFVTLLIFYGFGLLLSFTPCILPMIPVLSGILVGHGHDISARKAFFLSLTYVLSIAFTYAILGAMVALLGANLQITMQSPWAISLFSLLFVLLSLSMFGLFELQLPLSWQTKLTIINSNQTKGQYISAGIMGVLSTLILSPCVTAPLIGALSYIAHSGNVIMGGSSLFFLSLGMGTPLLLIGTSAGHWLPKTGHWMNAVKFLFGIMLLAVAIYLMSRILPATMSMGLWAILLIFSGIYAGALLPAYSHQDKFKQASGIILLIYGVFLLTGASMGGSDVLRPLALTADPLLTTNNTLSSTRLDNLLEVKSAITNAKDRVVMLDFYADWCESCHQIEATVFHDPKVLAALKKVIVLKADVTANNKADKALMHYFNVVAPPTFLFFDKSGKERADLRLVGNVTSADFLRNLKAVHLSLP